MRYHSPPPDLDRKLLATELGKINRLLACIFVGLLCGWLAHILVAYFAHSNKVTFLHAFCNAVLKQWAGEAFVSGSFALALSLWVLFRPSAKIHAMRFVLTAVMLAALVFDFAMHEQRTNYDNPSNQVEEYDGQGNVIPYSPN